MKYDSAVSAEMPKYQCHKKVWALKIARIEPGAIDTHSNIIPEEPGYGPIPVPNSFLVRHQPQAGGYYVVYEDGYVSYSPAAAFESGYTRIDQ